MRPWAAPASEAPRFIAPEPTALPLITPLHIFAARRERFDVIVRRTWSAPRVIAALFDEMPLAENGWDHDHIKITHIGNSEGLYPIWRVERT